MFTDEAGEVLHAVLSVIEEVGHSLGQHLTVVGDEDVLGVIDNLQQNKE